MKPTKRYGAPKLVAKNDRQGELLACMDLCEQVVALGPAGTGKTYLAAAYAAELLTRRAVRRIVLTRPTVAVGEDLGYFPGTQDEKIAPWVVPLMAVLRERLGGEKLQQAMSDGEIEVVPLQMMRGRTLDDCFLILDEAQNATPEQLKMLLTRHGANCKMLINGDLRQSDLRAESGLSRMIRVIEHHALPVPIVEFSVEDIVRSGVCRMWVESWTD